MILNKELRITFYITTEVGNNGKIVEELKND